MLRAAPKPTGAVPLYKNPKASIEDRVKDLLPRMSLEEKVSQLIQGDLNGWMNMTDPADNTLTYNKTGMFFYTLWVRILSTRHRSC